jgi:Fic family protein
MSQLYQVIDRQLDQVRPFLEQNEEAAAEFNQRLDISWIYHDNALEGVVLSYHELNSSIDDAIISDSTLIPHYDELRNHRAAIEYVRASAARRKPALNLDLLKRLHLMVTGEVPAVRGSRSAPPAGGQYRKDNPLHRLYFHEIAPPEKISYQMRKLVQWLGSAEAKKLHPVRRAATAHHKLITIYPWPRHSGKVARLLMNAMLLRDGLVPAVIHAVERQRYYEVLRQPPVALTELVAESLNRTLGSARKLIEASEARAAS